MNDNPMMKVYYNSACPVCKAAIERQMDRDNVCDIHWKDVHHDNALVSEVGSELEYVRERLHVVDESGQVQIGFDAILAIWRHSPSESWKEKLFGLPLIKSVCHLGYNVFASLLYQWNRTKKHW